MSTPGENTEKMNIVVNQVRQLGFRGEAAKSIVETLTGAVARAANSGVTLTLEDIRLGAPRKPP
jgi:hydroxypyruvate isomerase